MTMFFWVLYDNLKFCLKDPVYWCPILKNLFSKSAILDLFSEMMLSLMTLLIGIYWKLSLILEQNGIFLNNSQNTVTKRNYFIDRCQVFSNSSHQNYIRFSSGLFGFQHLTRLFELDLKNISCLRGYGEMAQKVIEGVHCVG